MNRSHCARSYAFHGLCLRVSCDPAVASAVHARLAQFPLADQSEGDITFEFSCVDDAEEHLTQRQWGAERSVYESTMGEVLYADDVDRLSIHCSNGVRALCDPERGRTDILIPKACVAESWLISHPMLTLPLIEMLKRRGLYSIHASGIAIGGKGLLFPGTSGAGKSTLTIALLRAGLGFLGDDMLFLTHGPEGVRALAFPDDIDVADGTVRLFPELADMLNAPAAPGWPKHQVCAAERYDADVVWTCQPAALVFPRVSGAPRSVLEPMDRMEALLELAPNVLLTAPHVSQKHLDALAELIETCDCYRLETGQDFDSLPTLLAELVR